MKITKLRQPKEGWDGMKENISSDVVSGFFVFLLALPLSMGIAQASDFLPIYGLITAMIGGIIVSFFAGSHLTIKGPAAGLIVIVATAVAEFGGGIIGWQLTLGVIVAAGILQILFGILRLGVLSDFFPLSVVHGMLAAIGIIIISKQIHGIVGQNPLTDEGKPILEPMELILAIPNSFSKPDIRAMIIGIIILGMCFGMANY
jgi:MFS superfamily sulfate permease-like transporter